jgi:hypothetical protein
MLEKVEKTLVIWCSSFFSLNIKQLAISLRPRLFPFILRNWNLNNGVCYFFKNVTFHNSSKFIYKPISNSWGER